MNIRKFPILVFSIYFLHSVLSAQVGSWSVKTFGNGTCYDVNFPDTTYGWAVGDSGRIMRSTNGGLTWTNQTSPTGRDLYAVEFLDRNTGYAVGAAGTVLKTSNGGTNWIAHPTTEHVPWKRVHFSDPLTGWLLSDTVSSKIHYTTDGGSTWSQIGPQLSPGLSTADMSFPTGTHGWIASDAILLHTEDGINWMDMNNAAFIYLFGVSFPSDSVGYLLHVYSDGMIDISVIFTTTDAGQSWTQLPESFPGVILSSVSFINPTDGWVAGDSLYFPGLTLAAGVGYHTTDGGFHWTRELDLDSSHSYATIKRIRFNDPGHGWIAGSSLSTAQQSRVVGKYYGPVTGVEDRGGSPPAYFSLSQNYPNPFNPTTEIHFTLDRGQHVRLQIFDLNGKRILQLVDHFFPPGEYSETFSGTQYPSGIYYYRLQAGLSSATKKMILLK